jgi:hypothetical protein
MQARIKARSIIRLSRLEKRASGPTRIRIRCDLHNNENDAAGRKGRSMVDRRKIALAMLGTTAGWLSASSAPTLSHTPG